MDGFQTSNAISRIYGTQRFGKKKPRICYCSAFNDDYNMEKAKQAGMDFFLPKPLSINEL
jgi:CheY-like chemotaxis protein